MLKNMHYANGQKTYKRSGNQLTYYFKNGRVKAEGCYENDLMEGEWRFYRETGQLWQIGHFAGGKKNGGWIRYDKNGEPEYAQVFKDDKIITK